MTSSKRIELRQSQLITTFGPGAMVDLPTRSVIIGGLDLWEMRDTSTWEPINEPRAIALLETVLSHSGRLADGVRLSLRSPPANPRTQRNGEVAGIRATIFPTWFVARDGVQTGNVRRRRLLRWRDLDPKGGFVAYIDDDGKRTQVTPIRFVGACKAGHIQDIDWAYTVHGGTKCGRALWLEESGTSGDPQSIRIVCDCGNNLSLVELQTEKRLGGCRGYRPWLNDYDPHGCSQSLKFLTRTATNAYFPQVLTVISLPAAEDKLTGLVEAHFDTLRRADSVTGIGDARRYNDKVRAALEGYEDDAVYARVQQVQTAQGQHRGKSPKFAEYELLGSGSAVIGANTPDSKLYAETLPRDAWGGDGCHPAIASVVAVHRLREVVALYGFTRFEAAPTSIDGDLDEIYLAVEGAALATETDWLPAIEQRGEGIFLRFDTAVIAAWLAREGVANRVDELDKAFRAWSGQQSIPDKHDFPGGPYYALHSLSHALMNEIALECGYPSTSLKERIYPLSDEQGEDRFGLLIYTATAGTQGTLGGLLSVLPRLGALIDAALGKLELCSNDPICAEHDPASNTDERALAGAACHSCLLIAETSCEQRNLYLDRALVVPTITTSGAALLKTD